MAESSRFWATNGTGDGIGTGFTVTHWQNFLLKLFEGGEEVNGAVLRGVGSALQCSGTATPITVPTGAAIGYGYFYENDANVTHAVTTPVVGTTGGHIVIETNWAAQTVRTKMYKNTDGISTPPALTQTAGTLWQTRLCTFTITTGGVIAITDARAFAHYSTEVVTAMLADLNVTTAKLANLAVTTGKIADDAVTTAKLLNANVTAAKLAAGAALANLGFTPWHAGNDGAGSGLDADLLDGQNGTVYLDLTAHTGQISTAQIANDAVDDTKAGARVPMLTRRQGGSATDWNTTGAASQTPVAVKMQAGSLSTGALSGSTIDVTLTFPQAFSAVPLVFPMIEYSGAGSPPFIATVKAATASNCTINVRTTTGAAFGIGSAFAIFWFAIGTE